MLTPEIDVNHHMPTPGSRCGVRTVMYAKSPPAHVSTR
jgi:hypothetical protein